MVMYTTTAKPVVPGEMLRPDNWPCCVRCGYRCAILSGADIVGHDCDPRRLRADRRSERTHKPRGTAHLKRLFALRGKKDRRGR